MANCNVEVSVGGIRIAWLAETVNEGVVQALAAHAALEEKLGRTAPAAVETHVCPIHGVTMRRHEKDGHVWYSHRLEGGGWCNGKQKEKENGGA